VYLPLCETGAYGLASSIDLTTALRLPNYQSVLLSLRRVQCPEPIG
jgi:hypothetical protein